MVVKGKSPLHSSMLITQKDADRFWCYVQKTDSCWLWTGGKNQKGYGQFKINGLMIKAHRISFALAYLEVSDLDIHHICNNRLCVNPDHLEEINHADHNRLPDPNTFKCGHPIIESNYYINNGYKVCRICKLASNHRTKLRARKERRGY